MAEALHLDPVLAALRARFPDVRKLHGLLAGYVATCPLGGVASFTVRGVLEGCNEGHDREEILAPSDVFAEPGSDDGEEPPSAPSGPVPILARAQDAHDLLAEPIPEIEWLISPWLQEKTTALLLAPPNAGKTLLAMDFAVQVARTRRVLFIEEEGHKKGFQTRTARAIAAAGGLERVPRGNLVTLYQSELQIIEQAERLAVEVELFDLVIIDSLWCVAVGLDENKAEEMGLLAQAMKVLARRGRGRTVLGLHHTTKAVWAPGTKPSMSDSRGSGALVAAVDTVLALVPMETTGGKVNAELWITKGRDQARDEKRTLSVEMSGPAAIVEMEQTGPGMFAKADNSSAINKAVISYMSNAGRGVSKTYLENNVRGYRAQAIRQAVDRMKAAGTIVEAGRNSYLISTPSAPSDGVGTGGSPADPVPIHPTDGDGTDRPGRTGRVQRNWMEPEDER